VAVAIACAALVTRAATPCRIEVIERGSGWPVPMVELRTTHQTRWISDNAGVVAFDLPELMGQETWFDVFGHGYTVPKDGFGYTGVRLTPQPGQTLRVVVDRKIIAKRLGRLTGGGLFAESQKTGQALDWTESGVLGCDSVQTAAHRGRLYWLWGDTTLARYPLGIFDSSGAWTDRAPFASFEPPIRPRFNYFTQAQGRLRGITPMPGSGPTWATGMISLPDRDGTARLVCAYMKVRPPLEEYEWGLAAWDEATEQFARLKVLWTKSEATPQRPLVPAGHPVRWRDPSAKEWILFGHPFPSLRCPATYEAWQDPGTWEPLTPPTLFQAANSTERIKPHDGVHSGSIAWNKYRRRWISVFMQAGGKPSSFGELWYAEAASPMGPWGQAIKVLSHENYTFYNPRLQPELTPEDASFVLFEGTYTHQFADRPQPTPRYDYNQILYRLDLNDPALTAAH
jgi:hypothetical protein